MGQGWVREAAVICEYPLGRLLDSAMDRFGVHGQPEVCCVSLLYLFPQETAEGQIADVADSNLCFLPTSGRPLEYC